MSSDPDTETESNLIDQLLAMTRHFREHTEPFRPLVIWQPINGDSAVIAGFTSLTGEVRDDLDTVFKDLRDTIGSPEWFAVLLDSYNRDTTPGNIPTTDIIGLEEAFKAGDMSVTEQMVTIVMHPPTEELLMFRQVYRWLPSEGWEWEKPQLIENADDAVCTAVRMFH